jgi:hypothetical protein
MLRGKLKKLRKAPPDISQSIVDRLSLPSTTTWYRVDSSPTLYVRLAFYDQSYRPFCPLPWSVTVRMSSAQKCAPDKSRGFATYADAMEYMRGLA